MSETITTNEPNVQNSVQNVNANRGLEEVPGVAKVMKIPVPMEVKFANSGEIIETLEGPVSYNPGDAILTGTKGESWPVARSKFLEPRFGGALKNIPGLDAQED